MELEGFGAFRSLRLLQVGHSPLLKKAGPPMRSDRPGLKALPSVAALFESLLELVELEGFEPSTS